LEKHLPTQHNAYLVSNTDDLRSFLLVLSYYVISRRLGWAGWQLVVWEQDTGFQTILRVIFIVLEQGF